MRRESHRYRGVRRSSRGAGWGHRAVYVASAIAAASLMAGFGLAGYWFGTFSHTYNQATATGFEGAPYGVIFLSAGVTEAAFVNNINYTNVTWNSSTGPCSSLNYTGANVLNQTGALNPLNLSSPNATNSKNNSGPGNATTIVCLNAINNANETYLWENYSGYNPFDNASAIAANSNESSLNNSTGWDNITLAANNSTLTPPQFNISLANLTGNANNSNTTLNITGCNPVIAGNNSTGQAELANCPFFATNNNTTYIPHAGFYASNGSWVSEANYSARNNSTLWHPNQTGYLPSDSVFYLSMEFVNTLPNVTYEVVVSLAGATPIPQVFFVNTGSGGLNETLTFVFDMTAAWFTQMPGGGYGFNDFNATNNSYGGFGSDVFAAIDTFSATVSQCYLDASAMVACPDTLGGTGFP